MLYEITTDKRKQYVVYAAHIVSVGMGTQTSLQADIFPKFVQTFKNNGYRELGCMHYISAYTGLEHVVMGGLGGYT